MIASHAPPAMPVQSHPPSGLHPGVEPANQPQQVPTGNFWETVMVTRLNPQQL